jgi:hypothetical protein
MICTCLCCFPRGVAFSYYSMLVAIFHLKSWAIEKDHLSLQCDQIVHQV